MKLVTRTDNPQYVPAHTSRGAFDLRMLVTDTLLELSMSSLAANDSELANVIGYSGPQVHRLCMSAVGQTAHSFVTRLRLERAAGQLAVEQRNVCDVVPMSGFLARESFSRAFAAQFSCSPAEFKLRNRGTCLPLPGYQLEIGGEWSRSVRIRSSATISTTFMFDGPVLIGRVMNHGSIDWRSTFRRDRVRIS